MSFEIPQLRDLKRQSELEIRSSLRKNDVRFSFGKAIASVCAGTSFILHRHINWLYRQIFLSSCDEDTLEERGREYGLPRKLGSKAFGLIRLTGENGFKILRGTEFKSLRTGKSYFSEEEASIDQGFALVPVEAEDIGVEYNLNSQDEIQFVSPLPRVNSKATVDVDGIANGSDREEVEEYRARFLEFVQTQSSGGSVADFIAWARSTPGVARAWVYREWFGPASVGILCQESSKALPDGISAQLKQAVTATLNLKAPVISRIFVVDIRLLEVRLNIRVKPNTAAIRTDIFNIVSDFFINKFEPAGFRRADATVVATALTGKMIRDLFLSGTVQGLQSIIIDSIGTNDSIILSRAQIPTIRQEGITFTDG